MEERTDHYTCYISYYEASKGLSDKKYRKFRDSIDEYCFFGIEPDFGKDDALNMAWNLVKRSLDNGIARQIGGKKGGQASGESRKAKTFEGTLEPTFEGTFPINKKEKENINKKENKKGSLHNIAAFNFVCRECGGQVIKSNCSPNYTCTTCHSFFKPEEVHELRRMLSC